MELFNDHEQEIADLDAGLLAVVCGTPWEKQVAKLTPDMPLAQRATLYRKLRDAHAVPDVVAFFLIAWVGEETANGRITELYEREYRDRFERMEDEYDIDPMAYLEQGMDDVPEEYEALNAEFGNKALALTINTLQAMGEHQLADLYCNDPEEYTRQYLEGEQYLFGLLDEMEIESEEA